MEVTAEGVEAAAQEAILHNLECCVIQGFEFSKPIEPNELLKIFEVLREKAKAIVNNIHTEMPN